MNRRLFLARLPALGAIGCGVGALKLGADSLSQNNQKSPYDHLPYFIHPDAVAQISSGQEVIKSSVGTVASIREDKDKNVLIKQFKVNGWTCGQCRPMFNTEEAMDLFYKTEKKVYGDLQSIKATHIPGIHGFDDQYRALTMTKYAQDLYSVNAKKPLSPDADMSVQLINILESYREIGIVRSNVVLSNFVVEKNKIIPLDYKLARPRTPENAREEIRSLAPMVNVLFKKEYWTKILFTYSDVLSREELYGFSVQV